MKRRMILGFLLAGRLLAADLPSAESLLDRFVDATGGKQVYAAHKSEIQHGTVEMPAMGVKGTLTRYAAEPDHVLILMDIPGIGQFVTGAKDGVAWENSVLMGGRIKTGVERAEALREARFNSFAVWRELYPKVETAGEESVDGEDCYKVVMTPKEGAPEIVYLSKKTGLGVKMTTVATTQMGELPAEMIFGGYKSFGGILMPTLVTSKTAGQEIFLRIDSVEINPTIPAARFDVPPELVAR